MKYTTLEDLKKWPKLYEAAKWNIENTEKSGLEGDLCSFVWHKSDQGRRFWETVVLGYFVAARALRPDLFDVEKTKLTPCERLGYKVGDRFRVVKDNCCYFEPGEIVYLICDDGSSCPTFCREMTKDIHHKERHYLWLSEVVPLTVITTLVPVVITKRGVLPATTFLTNQEEKTEYKHIEYGFSSGNGFYTKVVGCEQKTERLNAAMLDRDGPEEPCNTEPTVNPMDKHSDALSRALGAVPFAITKFDSRGL